MIKKLNFINTNNITYMKILIAGAGGFIAGHLTRALAAEGASNYCC